MSHARNVHLNTVHNRNEKGVGDSDRLSDQIFASTGVGEVKLTTNDMADYYIARNYLVNDRAFNREKVVRGI